MPEAGMGTLRAREYGYDEPTNRIEIDGKPFNSAPDLGGKPEKAGGKDHDGLLNIREASKTKENGL